MPTSASPSSHRVTLVLAAIALLLGAYGVWRFDSMRDHQVATAERLQQLELQNKELRATLDAQLQRESEARAQMQAQWRALSELPQQVRDLTAAHEDLRSRTERPQRAWSRAEAAYLLELAQRRLQFDRDVPTAIAALEAADSRLAALRDAAFDGARQQIAKDLQALKAVSDPDRVGIMSRLIAIEAQVDTLQLKGVLIGQRFTATPSEPTTWLGRVRRGFAAVFERFFAVHRLEGEGARIVTLEAQALRRQHLASLIYDARHAVLLNDAGTYRTALTAIDAWLHQYFAADEDLDAVAAEIAALEKIDIAPPLPDLAPAIRLLSPATGSR